MEDETFCVISRGSENIKRAIEAFDIYWVESIEDYPALKGLSPGIYSTVFSFDNECIRLSDIKLIATLEALEEK